MKKNKLFLTALIIGFAFLTTLPDVYAQGGNNFFGAVSTSTADGSAVNANLYATKDAVYLKGGPQNTQSQGLPNGTYYFQVTDPSGATLLSTDPAVCRQVQVVGGVITGAASAAGACAHSNGIFNPATGATPVKLMPFNDTPNNGGEYKLHLIRQTSTTSVGADGLTLKFQSKDSKTDNFKVRKSTCTTDCNPITYVTLSGTKFYDANANSINDNEAGIAGVRVNIFVEGNLLATAITGADGKWSASIPADSNYKVCEILPVACPSDAVGSYWVQTAPFPDGAGEQCYSGTASADVAGLNFGNVFFVPAKGGYTLGFWSNKNGQAIMKSNDNFAGALQFLSGLNLKDYSGTDFNPGNYMQFRSWLLNGNAVNMAYMLSVQLAATSLDVRYGSLSDGTIVDARGLGLGFPTIGSLRNSANTELNYIDPSGTIFGSQTFTGNPLRQDEEIIKNALDAINNNRLPFASPTQPAGVCYPL